MGPFVLCGGIPFPFQAKSTEGGSTLADIATRKAVRHKKWIKSRMNIPLHLMLLPGVIVVLIYSYVPMVGLIMAFQDFNIYLGIEAFWKSEFVGLQNFVVLWNMGEPVRVVFNTVKISFLKLVFGFSFPIVVSLLLNEVHRDKFKRVVQTVIYLPHFLSWVLIAGIIRQLMSEDGIISQFLSNITGQNINILTNNQLFVPMLIVTDIWKGFGFGTIVYLAAITGIDPALYEAAQIDGANRLQQTVHVTLPGMTPIIVLQLILSLQNVLNAGFDQIFNLYNVMVYESADIIDTWVYRMSFESTAPMYHYSTAIGLFKSVVSFIFIMGSYYLANRYANYEIF